MVEPVVIDSGGSGDYVGGVGGNESKRQRRGQERRREGERGM